LCGARKVTKRQIQVLALIARGLTNFQVATLLHVTPRTVRHHLNALQQHLGQTNSCALVAAGIISGLLDNSTWPVVSTGSRCPAIPPKACSKTQAK
jgi:DNA-binding CsgD family transcriptional regulator